MANSKNSKISVPLTGELNLNKIKTGITQYTGFNDLNSPLYGDTISPLYTAEYDELNINSDRPYMDNGILRAGNGEELANYTQEKGLVRELLNVPNGTIAVKDNDHYVNVSFGSTILHTPAKDVKLGYSAAAAAYSIEQYHLVFIVSKKRIEVYNSETGDLITTDTSIDSDTAYIRCFHDPLCNWTVISVWQPFQDWEKKVDRGSYSAGATIDIDPNYPKPFNYVFDQTTNTFGHPTFSDKTYEDGKKDIRMDPRSYVFTGIDGEYLRHTKYDGTPPTWNKNTDSDCVFYRVAATPYKLHVGVDNAGNHYIYDGVLCQGGVRFRERNPNFDIKFVQRNGYSEPTGNRELIISDYSGPITFSGTCKNGTIMTWISSSERCGGDLGEAYYTVIEPEGLYRKTPLINKGATTPFDKCTNSIALSVPTVDGEVITWKDNKNVFRLNYTNGVMTNISATKSLTQVGTNIETNNELDVNFYPYFRYGENGQEIVYKNNFSEWVRCRITDKVDSIRVFNERYVVVYTLAQNNFIDVSTRQVNHFASDWNNRFSLDGSLPPYGIDTGAYENANYTRPIELAGKDIRRVASGIRLHPEDDKSPVVGTLTSAVPIGKGSTFTPVGFMDIEKINIYTAELGSSTCKYYKTLDTSVINGSTYNSAALAGKDYPGGSWNIPNLFCNIEYTPFGTAFLKYGDRFYVLLSPDKTPIFAYDTSRFLDAVREVFLIQGQPFTITDDNYIRTVSFIKGTPTKDDAVVKINGLQYCGCTPTMAVFYSPMDRTIKTFTADRVLSTLEQATDISKIYYTAYNPQTFEIYLATNKGLYIWTGEYSYRRDIYNIKDIYFGGEGNKHTYITYTNEKGENKVIDTLYQFDDVTSKDFRATPVKLRTRFYGNGKNDVLITDCIYFRLFCQEVLRDAYIKVSEKTVTDGVYTTASKTIPIRENDWDKGTNTCYVRYQPKFQRAVGTELSLETDVSISEITFSVSSPTTTQVSKPVLNI